MTKLLSNVMLIIVLLSFGRHQTYAKPFDPAIPAPEFIVAPEPEGTTLELQVYTNEADIERTEIWQREAGETEYRLIYDVPGAQVEFDIQDLKPRTTYEFRARLYSAGEYSPFSFVSHTTYSNFYPPDFYISNADNGGVDMTIVDNSYADVSFTIFRQGQHEPHRQSLVTFNEPDSGNAIDWFDETAISGETYTYTLETYYEVPGGYHHEQSTEFTVTQIEKPLDFALVIEGEPEGTLLNLGIYHNEEGITRYELYRRVEGETDFTKIYDGTEYFFQFDLSPRITYEFKAKIYRGGVASDFSNTLTHTTYSNIYFPEFAVANHDGGVMLTLKDLSYADVAYTIRKAMQGEDNDPDFALNIQLPDSGQTWTYQDNDVEAGQTYVYELEMYFENPRGYTEIFSHNITVTGESEMLEAPILDYAAGPVYGTTTYFTIHNPNDAGTIQFFRSMGDTLNYVQFVPQNDGSPDAYRDSGLKPRTEYFYKARVVHNDETSSFSNVLEFTTYSDYFDPFLTASLTEEGYIKLVLTDNSYADLVYELERDKPYENGDYFLEANIVMSDSGSQREFIDSSVVANTTYTYKVNVVVEDEGMPFYFNVANATITTPPGNEDGPRVTGFVLVDPYTHTDVRPLMDLDTLPYSARYNIRAEATGDTESVEFFLNNTRFGENQVPYALFGDRDGNYHRGRLKPGDYTLTATPYTGNLQAGEQGETSTIHFTVVNDGSDNMTNDLMVQVNIFPNPVVSTGTVEISAASNSVVSIELRGQTGQTLVITKDLVGDDGLLFHDWSADNIPPGLWYMVVKVDDQTFTKRLVIE